MSDGDDLRRLVEILQQKNRELRVEKDTMYINWMRDREEIQKLRAVAEAAENGLKQLLRVDNADIAAVVMPDLLEALKAWRGAPGYDANGSPVDA